MYTVVCEARRTDWSTSRHVCCAGLATSYLQEVDTKRDVRLQRMEQQQQRVESLLQLIVQQQEPKQTGAHR